MSVASLSAGLGLVVGVSPAPGVARSDGRAWKASPRNCGHCCTGHLPWVSSASYSNKGIHLGLLHEPYRDPSRGPPLADFMGLPEPTCAALVGADFGLLPVLTCRLQLLLLCFLVVFFSFHFFFSSRYVELDGHTLTFIS